MKEKKQEEDIFSLRRNVRKLQDRLSFIARLSWRLKETRDTYDITSSDPEELFKLFQELVDIEEDLKTNFYISHPLEEKEVANEK